MPAHPPEEYLREVRDIRRSGSAVPETSYYPALAGLLDAVGATLRPKVRCIVNPSHGSGIPDIGLSHPISFRRLRPRNLFRAPSSRGGYRGEAHQQ